MHDRILYRLTWLALAMSLGHLWVPETRSMR